MKNYIVHSKVTKDELKYIYDNMDKFNIVNQMEIWAIIGRSLSATSLISTLTNQKVTFYVRHNNFHLIVTSNKGKFEYDFNLPRIDVNWLPDSEINLSEYLMGAKFNLKIGEKEYECDYIKGTISEETAFLLKMHFPNQYNVISLGVLIDKFKSNEIIISAGFIMIFTNDVDSNSLLSVVNKIPKVTRLLLAYDTEIKLHEYLILTIEEEILKNNIKYN